jgi:alpha-ribazole phosphatase
MKKIFLIRHGSIDYKYDGCYIGAMNVSLAPKGLKEAAAVGRYITDINCDHIFASPMLRVKQTLEVALPPEKVKTVEYKENIREVNFGDWEGKSFSEINERYPNEVNNWAEDSTEFSFPNGSTLTDFYSRIELFKKTLLDTSGSKIMVFAHGGVILALICSILGLEKEKMLGFKVDRGSISSVELFENGYGVLTGLNIKG